MKQPLSWEAILAGAMPLSESAPRDTSRGPGYEVRVLSFMLGREEYAIDILRIREIIRVRPITDVPRAPAFVPGILSLRGTIVPVLDLRKRLRMPAAPFGKATRILIVSREDELFGLVIDEVRNVVPLRGEEIEQTPAVISSNVQADFLSGIGRPAGSGMLILVNLDAVLSFEVGGGR